MNNPLNWWCHFHTCHSTPKFFLIVRNNATCIMCGIMFMFMEVLPPGKVK